MTQHAQLLAYINDFRISAQARKEVAASAQACLTSCKSESAG